MVTRIHKGKKPRLYLTEWMKHLDLDDAVLAGRIVYYEAKNDRWIEGVKPPTIWRWRKEQWRLDPFKIQGLADAMGLNGPESFYQRPPRQSLDAAIKEAPDHIHAAALDYVRLLTERKAS